MTGNPHPAKEDRRVARTRRVLHTALIDLMIEKGYDAVTVQDIIDRADVGRSTFYAHFPGKKTLLLSQFEELEVFLAEQQKLSRSRPSPADPVDSLLGFSLPMFQHVAEHRRTWAAIAGRQAGSIVIRQIEGILERIVGRDIGARAHRRSPAGIPPAVITQFVVQSMLGLMTWWLDQADPYPPEEIDRMFRQLAAPSIAAALLS
jgi:AcrR family transcriptional regulator